MDGKAVCAWMWRSRWLLGASQVEIRFGSYERVSAVKRRWNQVNGFESECSTQPLSELR